MLIIPAIDIKDGCVVRFVQGRLNKKIYSRNPLKTARHWVKQGAELIHVVDLDGAFSGKPKNLGVVKEIVQELTVPVQFGGGVRDILTIKELIKSGVSRVVLGTRAVKDETFLKKAFKLFKHKIIVAIDAQADTLKIQGWKASSGKVLDFVQVLRKIGFKELIYTDTLKDGTLKGPNIRAIKALLKETRMKIIASGGISSLGDIVKLKKLQKDGLIGVIIGKALYEGKFTLPQALKMA